MDTHTHRERDTCSQVRIKLTQIKQIKQTSVTSSSSSRGTMCKRQKRWRWQQQLTHPYTGTHTHVCTNCVEQWRRLKLAATTKLIHSNSYKLTQAFTNTRTYIQTKRAVWQSFCAHTDTDTHTPTHVCTLTYNHEATQYIRVTHAKKVLIAYIKWYLESPCFFHWPFNELACSGVCPFAFWITISIKVFNSPALYRLHLLLLHMQHQH